MPNITIVKVVIQIGEHEIPLTVEAAKSLRDALIEMFPENKKVKTGESAMEDFATKLEEMREEARRQREQQPHVVPYPVPYPVYPRYPHPYWDTYYTWNDTSLTTNATLTLSDSSITTIS